MTPSPSPLTAALANAESFALIARDGATVELLTGEIVDVERLADIPLSDAGGTPREVLALVPFRQVRRARVRVPRRPRAAALPHRRGPRVVPARRCSRTSCRRRPSRCRTRASTSRTTNTPTSSAASSRTRSARGEGANFVIRRDFTASVDADAKTAALTWFRALLEFERGAYWTFAIVTPDHIAVGASPEAHVSAQDGVVTMNPISGTFRHPAGGATAETLTEFLESTKETEELFMVVDEELKMMSAVCSDGGRITGPHLKEMSRLTHTEYVLRGRSRLDPRDILRETMFAPTVTGSPMQNACTVITRHERKPRGLLLRRRGAVHPAPLDDAAHRSQPTSRRTTSTRRSSSARPISWTGGCACPSARRSCATPTLTARSTRRTERPRECSARSAPSPATPSSPSRTPSTRTPPLPSPSGSPTTPAIASLLTSRNARLAPFWLNPQDAGGAGPFAGRSAIVVDVEDRFTTMLAHQLRHLGLSVEIVPWSVITDSRLDEVELVVCGPGPGDPRDPASPRIRRMREVVAPAEGIRAARFSPCASATRSSPTRSASTSHRWRGRTRVFRSPSTSSAHRRRSASTTRSRRASPRNADGGRCRGLGGCRDRRRLRAAGPGLRVGAGSPGVDPVARRDVGPRAARGSGAHADTGPLVRTPLLDARVVEQPLGLILERPGIPTDRESRSG